MTVKETLARELAPPRSASLVVVFYNSQIQFPNDEPLNEQNED